MSNIDLHIHSNISLDGTYSIKEIIEKAKDNNMKMIALTDHNSVKGVKEAIELGTTHSIKVVPGIEIDCVFKGVNLHMTAYNIDINDLRYSKIEKFYLDNSIENTWKATYKFLEKTKLNISKEILDEIAVQGVLVPEDICEYLLSHSEYDDLEILKPYRKNGSRSDNPNVNFYWDYFSQGKIGYFKEEKIDALEIIDLIHDTGGIAVVAHPKANFKDKDDILEELLKLVDGLEVFSTYHNEEDCLKYLELAKKYDLKITCGSDFHGIHKPSIEIGKIPGNEIEKYINL